MDRLTAPDGYLCRSCAQEGTCQFERSAGLRAKCPAASCYERLAAYEDTGLTPEEIQQIRQPAADMQEVRRGKWRQVFKGALHDCFECSACGHKDCEYTLNYHYRPHCGAKMEGDEK